MDNDDQSTNQINIVYDISSDEPTSKDKLGREEFALSLANLAVSRRTQTPLVVGIYGPWGMGKTSFMKIIYEKIKDDAHCVWFDPWMHQFDENPIIAFIHTLRESLDKETREKAKIILMAVTKAIGFDFFERYTGVSLSRVGAVANKYKEDRFLIHEERTRLRKRFIELIGIASKSNNGKRLVFFIDDLDRCRSDVSLKILEALKLYLNIEGCVYFLGADKEALDEIVNDKINVSCRKNYLEKIVQLPFCLPPIDTKNNIISYIDSLCVDDRLKPCREMLIKCLGHNPRQLKRFVNILSLNDQLAKKIIKNRYNPLLLSFSLLVQMDSPKLYDRLIIDYDKVVHIYYFLTEGVTLNTETEKFFESYFFEKHQLQNALSMMNYLPEKEEFECYLYLTSAVGVEKDVIGESKDSLDEKSMIQESMEVGERKRIIRAHNLWLKTNEKEGAQANFSKVNLSGAGMDDVDLSNSIFDEAILFSTVFDGATLNDVSFKGAYLNDAVFSRVSLQRANFSNAILTGANFEDVDLVDANLTAANLEKASLADAKLEDAILCRARLGGVDFSRASMSRVDLTKASLVNSTLDFADLSGAILDDADLSGASLNETILDFADLRWVSGLELEQLKTVKSMRMTKFHPRFWQILQKQYPLLLNPLFGLKQIPDFIINSITLNKLYDHARSNDCNITEKVRDRFVKSIYDLLVKLKLHSIDDAEQYLVSNLAILKKSFEVWRRVSGTKSYPKDGLIIVILILGSPGRLDVEEETKTWSDPYQKWMLLASSEL